MKLAAHVRYCKDELELNQLNRSFVVKYFILFASIFTQPIRNGLILYGKRYDNSYSNSGYHIFVATVLRTFHSNLPEYE